MGSSVTPNPLRAFSTTFGIWPRKAALRSPKNRMRLNRFYSRHKPTYFQQENDCPLDSASRFDTLRAIRIFNSVRIIRPALRSEISSPCQEGNRSARHREVV